MRLLLSRISQDSTQTIGQLKIIGAGRVREFCAVELPWKDNTRNISCIPEGVYPGQKVDHPKFGKSLLIKDVPGRSGIMVHVANHYHQLRGCIAPGTGFADIDKDGHVDVISSAQAMEEIYDVLSDEFILEIKNV